MQNAGGPAKCLRQHRAVPVRSSPSNSRQSPAFFVGRMPVGMWQNIPPISVLILRAQQLVFRITAGRSDPRPGVTPGVAKGAEEGVAPARSAVSRRPSAARKTRPMRARISLRFKGFSRQLAAGDLSTKLSTGGRRSSPRVGFYGCFYPRPLLSHKNASLATSANAEKVGRGVGEVWGRRRVPELVAEVFRHHPLDLSIALDDNWPAGSFVLPHRLVDAPLECLVNQVTILTEDATDVLLWVGHYRPSR